MNRLTADKKGNSREDVSRERGVEIQPRMAAQRGFTEDATDPLVAPQDYDVRQSGESWNSKTVVSGCDQQNYRSRTSEKWKAKFEEAKKQQRKKNDDGRSSANWQTSSLSWYQPMTWTPSLWQQWSSDETRERSDWKTSTDWSSSDPPRERSEWRTAFLAVTILMVVKNEYLAYEDMFNDGSL